jgi:hypothetical protein
MAAVRSLRSHLLRQHGRLQELTERRKGCFEITMGTKAKEQSSNVETA